MKSLGIFTAFVLACPVGFLAMVIWWKFTLAVLAIAWATKLAVRLAVR